MAAEVKFPHGLTPHIMGFGEVYPEENFEKSTFSAANNLSRVRNAACVSLTLISSLFDTVTGIAESILALPAAFLHEIGAIKKTGIIEDTSLRLVNSNFIMAAPFGYLVRSINPKAFRPDYCPPSQVNLHGLGLIADKVHSLLAVITSSKNSFVRHIASRLCWALAPIAFIIARIADGIIGLTAAPFALLLCGRSTTLNNIAYRGLQAPGLIFDLFTCAVCFISPGLGFLVYHSDSKATEPQDKECTSPN